MSFEWLLSTLGEKMWTSAEVPEFWTKRFHLCDPIEKQVSEVQEIPWAEHAFAQYVIWALPV